MEFNLIYKNMRLNEIKQAKYLLENKIYTKIGDISLSFARTKEPIPFKEKETLTYKPIKVSESWGDLFDCAWFKLTGKVDKQYLNKDLYLRFDVSGEALLYTEAGVPLKGFTNGSSVFDRQYGEPGKRNFKINDFIQKDGTFECFLDCGCNDLFGNYQDNGSVVLAEIAIKDETIETIYYDLETCIDLLLVYNEDSEEYISLFEILHQIYHLVEYEEVDMVSKIRNLTKDILKKDKKNQKTIHALGHAHLDLAWLWPIRETKRKLLRTLTNIFYLFEKYPDFKFGFSQPQLLEWLETESKELYEKVQYYHKLGRFELQGGAWVEMDTNITGEEAMIRQFLYGMNYYREHFDYEPKSLWLPDVFGYSGNLPQIIKKCGLDYFMTIKISWSLINRFPHHTFMYEGIDGSSVLAHMPPEGNYNSSAYAHSFKQTEDAYREREISNESLLLFGIGDGGGGPGDEHMERIARNENLSVIPNIDIISSEEFFEKLALKKETYPRHVGELYLENHQGTFTSQSNIKKYNRYLEQKLKTVEYLLAYNETQKYKTEMDRIWKEVLLYQFHDILPGSSIKRVYDETLKRYEVLDKDLDKIIECLSKEESNNSLMDAKYIFNPLQIDTTKYFVADDICRKVKIKALTSNKVLDEEYLIDEIEYSDSLETNNILLKLNERGEIISLVDKPNAKEYVSKRFANALRVYKDIGDAWNINYGYRAQTPKPLKLEEIKLFETNDFFEYRMIYSFRSSIVKQVMRVFKSRLYIEFEHDVNWQDLGYMLRSGFDMNIEANEAVSDIQFGYISRSRLSKTPIEKAMLEVPSQQWISIDDGKSGAALLNTSKYGYYIKDNVLDINLLRSTNYPCVDGDIGKTSYTYALYLHDADLSKVDINAKQLNANYVGFNKNLVKTREFTWKNNSIQLSAYKPAYNQEGNILRLYNNTNSVQETKIDFTTHSYQVTETNMIEDNSKDLGIKESLTLELKPFEVKTFRLIKDKIKGYFPYHINRSSEIVAFRKPIDHKEAILLSSLQGVLAKEESRLYLASSAAYTQWLEEIIAKDSKVITLETISDVLFHFKSDIKGYVIYKEKTLSQNIAASIAGVEGYILIEEKQLDYVSHLNIPFIDARELDYTFLLENYTEDLNFDLIIQQNPIYCGLYDMLALNAVFSSNIKEDLIDKGITLKKDTPILGWVPEDEVIGVTYLSEIDCNMVASNHSLNMTMFLNLQKPVFNNFYPKFKKTKKDKHFVTFVLSDGDNVQWMMGDYYQNQRTFGHKERGKIPFGWSISPSMYDLAPEILDLYYKNKTENDYMTSGVSGAGYMYPDQYSQEALEVFLDRTEFYFKKLGIEYLAILGTREFDTDKSSLEAYAKREAIKGGFLYANFERYKGYNGELFWHNSKPFVSARYALWDYENLKDLANKVNQGIVSPSTESGYSMIVVHTWSHTYQDVLDVISLFDENIEVLHPKQFMEEISNNVKR